MRIVIAEDSAIMREGLGLLLAGEGRTVVASVADGDSLLAAVETHRPDMCIVDVRMPPTHTDEGLRAALNLRSSHPEIGVLIFSQHVETTYASALLSSGATGVGYLLKDRVADVAEFLDAVNRVGNGGTALDPEVVAQLLASERTRGDLDLLTVREREVMELVAQGRSNTAIAAQLWISEGAVEKNISNIFSKLSLPTTSSDNRRVLAVLRYLQADFVTR